MWSAAAGRRFCGFTENEVRVGVSAPLVREGSDLHSAAREDLRYIAQRSRYQPLLSAQRYRCRSGLKV